MSTLNWQELYSLTMFIRDRTKYFHLLWDRRRGVLQGPALTLKCHAHLCCLHFVVQSKSEDHTLLQGRREMQTYYMPRKENNQNIVDSSNDYHHIILYSSCPPTSHAIFQHTLSSFPELHRVWSLLTPPQKHNVIHLGNCNSFFTGLSTFAHSSHSPPSTRTILFNVSVNIITRVLRVIMRLRNLPIPTSQP